MKKTLSLLLSALFTVGVAAYDRVSVHDPSIVVDHQGTYYVFGSHHAAARSTDLMNWTDVSSQWRWATSSSNNASHQEAFLTQQVTKVTIGGQEQTFPNFNARAWSAQGNGNYLVDGNMWAPDVIWNPVMQKWCMYMSINGDGANCSIVLLTADNITGPYRYQAPVVVSGFYMSGLDYHKTDLELALGPQSTLPSRYQTGNLNGWRHRWPNCIDPCVFYDEQGKLWMSYGSWHGGIFMLELDENTGLRDYDVKYEYTINNGNADDVRSDPYYGKKIAGGFQVSGEASYIRYFGGYYYLFITYGGLVANGGYQMRVFRSQNPDGPYADSFHNGAVAIYDAARVNYGPDGTRKTDRGEIIFGAYGDWGYQAVGSMAERSQGHNSVLVQDGRAYLVYHTRFQDMGEAHEVRVHQLLQNEDGWLCAAPFEYSGETTTDGDAFSTTDMAGKYKLLTHTYNLNHTAKQLALPVNAELNADGTISGEATGTWSIDGSHITLNVDGIEYKGLTLWQTLEPSDDRTIAFTAYAKSKGYSLWGYAPTGSQTVGATNNTTAYLGALSEQLQLNDGQKATFEFTNYTTQAENYHNWVACVSSGTTFNAANPLIALRADFWENVQWGNGGITANYNWDTFRADMDGSHVVLTVTYQNGSVTIHADITTTTGKQLFEEFTKSGVTGTITTCMSVDHSHLTMLRAEVGDATGISLLRYDGSTDAKADSRRWNLSGQQVTEAYRGLIIKNGRKYLNR